MAIFVNEKMRLGVRLASTFILSSIAFLHSIVSDEIKTLWITGFPVQSFFYLLRGTPAPLVAFVTSLPSSIKHEQ